MLNRISFANSNFIQYYYDTKFWQKKQEKNSNSLVNYTYIFVKKFIFAYVRMKIHLTEILIVVNKRTIWYNKVRI